MESFRDPIILSSIASYMLLCIAIGIWAMRRTTTTRDFFMAGRHLGIIVAGIAVFSSTMSAGHKLVLDIDHHSLCVCHQRLHGG